MRSPHTHCRTGGPYGPPEVCTAPGNCKRIPSDAPWAQFPAYCGDRLDWYVEQLQPGKQLFPADIFMAQLEARLSARRKAAG